MHGLNKEGRSIVWSKKVPVLSSSGTWKKVMAGAKEEASLLPTGCTVAVKKVKPGDGSSAILKAFRWLNITMLTLMLCWLTFLTVHTFRPEKAKPGLTVDVLRQLVSSQEVKRLQLLKVNSFLFFSHLGSWKEAARNRPDYSGRRHYPPSK